MLLDSCIVIDLLRGRQIAYEFIESLPDIPSVAVVTATELIAGIKGISEQRVVDRLLATYAVLDIDIDIARLAGEYLRQYGPSHGMEPMDALIAATAKTHDLPLATLNLEHFPMFGGLKRPYQE